MASSSYSFEDFEKLICEAILKENKDLIKEFLDAGFIDVEKDYIVVFKIDDVSQRKIIHYRSEYKVLKNINNENTVEELNRQHRIEHIERFQEQIRDDDGNRVEVRVEAGDSEDGEDNIEDEDDNEDSEYTGDAERFNLLNYYVITKNIEIVKLLVEYGVDTNFQTPEFNYTALHYAVLENNLEAVKFLLEDCGADPDLEDDDVKKPLEYAVTNPKTVFQITDLLVKSTRDISSLFSSVGYPALLELILDISGETIVEYYDSPFKEAVTKKGNSKTIKLLLPLALSRNLTEHDYLELILLSLQSNDFGTVKFIVEEALKNFPLSDEHTEGVNNEGVKDSLLKANLLKGHYKKTFKDNENIIFWCLELGCKYEIVEFLIKKKFKISDNDKHQIFYMCLKNYKSDVAVINILKLFLKYIKPNSVNTRTKNSFLYDILVENGLWKYYREDFFSLSLDRVKFLFEKGFYTSEDFSDNRLLKNIFIKNVGENQRDVSKYLLEKLFKALKINILAKKTVYINENNFLFSACDALNFNLIKILVEDCGACLYKVIRPNYGDVVEKDGVEKDNVLYPAVFCLFRQKLKNLKMMKEDDIFLYDKECLHPGCDSGCDCDFIERENKLNDNIYKCLRYLIQKDSSVINYVDKTFRRNFTLLHSVMFFLRCTDIEIIKLLATKQNISIKTIGGKTAVHLFCCSARDEHLGVLEHLLSLESEAEDKDLKGNTPLHYACMIEHFGYNSSNSKIIKFLIEKGCSMNTKNKEGKTPFDLYLESSVEDSGEE